MTFQPDIIISWDISKKDIPIIQVTEVKYDPKVKHVVGNVIATGLKCPPQSWCYLRKST